MPATANMVYRLMNPGPPPPRLTDSNANVGAGFWFWVLAVAIAVMLTAFVIESKIEQKIINMNEKLETTVAADEIARKTYIDKETGFVHEIMLPRSGRIATFKEGEALDLMRASMLAGDDKQAANFTLLEELCLLDGQKAYVSDFQKLKMKDFTALMGVFMEVNF